MEWLKSLWAKWKVQVTIVGGVLVVATAYGTCSVDPTTVSDNSGTNTNTTETVEVSATATETTGETNTTGATTTGTATATTPE
jgi:hypothetical protein